jgi:Interferon-related developmental regulator (IFRD)
VRQAAGEGAALLYSHSGLAADRDSPAASGWAHSALSAGVPVFSRRFAVRLCGCRCRHKGDERFTCGVLVQRKKTCLNIKKYTTSLVCRPGSPTAEAANGDSADAAHAEMDDVVARMRELATHRGDEQRRNKRDRASLKSTFRELITTVEVRFCHTWFGANGLGSRLQCLARLRVCG